LSGKKELLKLADVLFVKNVPYWEELRAQFVWDRVKNKPEVAKYFKDYNKTCPSRYFY